MVIDIDTARQLNYQIREACRILDESAAFARQHSPDNASEYAAAVGRVFEAISSELFDPIFKQHPEISN